MCHGKNLEWNYFPSNASLMNLASGKCITVTASGGIQQATCSATDSKQRIFYDPESGPVEIHPLATENLREDIDGWGVGDAISQRPLDAAACDLSIYADVRCIDDVIAIEGT